MLTNTSPYPVTFAWDLGFLGADGHSLDAALRGVGLEVAPATGAMRGSRAVLF